MLSSLVLWNYHQRERNRGDVQCQATWPEHFYRSEIGTCHMSESSSKVSAWLYYVKQLKRASIATKEIINLFSTRVRPVKEYAACPVFHNSLPSYLSSQMNLRACRSAPWELLILSHARTYQEALGLASLETLFERGQVQTVKLFQNISNNQDLANYTVFLPGSNR